jgi:hypothetical protein
LKAPVICMMFRSALRHVHQRLSPTSNRRCLCFFQDTTSLGHADGQHLTTFTANGSNIIVVGQRKSSSILTHLAQSSRLFSSTRPSTVSVAIVGSGPSGCYTAKYLLAALEKHQQPEQSSQQQKHQIDVFDRLPTPYGLVRYGVAPDHPEVKNVQNDFDALFQDKGVRFLGNVTVGQDVSVQELRQRYNVVVLAYGCESDRKLKVPGDDLKGVLSAREFVAWYNGGLLLFWAPRKARERPIIPDPSIPINCLMHSLFLSRRPSKLQSCWRISFKGFGRDK